MTLFFHSNAQVHKIRPSKGQVNACAIMDPGFHSGATQLPPTN